MTITIILLVVSVVSLALLAQPAFGATPKGNRLDRIKKSPNYRDGQFRNLQSTVMMTADRGRLSTMWHFITEKKNPKRIPTDTIPMTKVNLSALDTNKNQIVWMGHSSYLLVFGGKTILVDPVLTQSFPASMAMKPYPGTDLYKPEDILDIDCLIITHDHYDHLDRGTVKQIRNRVERVICPLGVGAHFEKWDYDPDRITELDWWEDTEVDSLVITCTPARHFSGRFLKSNPTLWASFMVQYNGRTVFIGGDSGYGIHFKQIGERFPNIDLAILENGQYNEEWRNIHTMPNLLPQVIKDLNPKKVQPVHNSKFALAKHDWDEPMRLIREAAEADSTINLLGATLGRPTEF